MNFKKMAEEATARKEEETPNLDFEDLTDLRDDAISDFEMSFDREAELREENERRAESDEAKKWKHRQQPGQPEKTDYDILVNIVQDHCPHFRTHGQGSNQYVKKTTCAICKKVLSMVPREKEKATSSGTNKTQSQQFAEFQEFMKWKKDQGST
eukprot:s1932_g6.t1